MYVMGDNVMLQVQRIVHRDKAGTRGKGQGWSLLLFSHKQNCYARISKDCTDICAGSLVKLWGSGYFRKL